MATRDLDPETLRASTHLVARGRTMIGRFAFDASVVYRRPDQIRVRASRPVPGGEFLELVQSGDELTLLFYKERRHYSGPLAPLSPSILEELPVEASWLIRVPLIDHQLAEALPGLREDRAPVTGPWRRHLALTGNAVTGEHFQEQRWMLDPETLTVEALALRLRGDEGLWLTIRFDAYQEFAPSEIEGLQAGESAVLPTEFRVSLARRPFRRVLRGERWSVEGRVSRYLLDRPVRDQDFVLPPPRGFEALALEHLGTR